MGSRGVVGGYCIASMALVFGAPRVAWGHPVGASESEVRVEAGGAVALRLHLGPGETGRLLPGVPALEEAPTPRSLALREAEATAFLARGVEVTRGESICEAGVPHLAGGPDGIVLEVTYRCEDAPGSLRVTYFFLGDLGPEHRHMGVLREGDRTQQALLTATQRSLTGLPRAPRPARRAWFFAVAALSGVVVWAAGRWRRRHRRHENEQPPAASMR